MDSINEQVKYVERLWMSVPGEKSRRKWKKERGCKVKGVEVEERQLRLYRVAPCEENPPLTDWHTRSDEKQASSSSVLNLQQRRTVIPLRVGIHLTSALPSTTSEGHGFASPLTPQVIRSRCNIPPSESTAPSSNGRVGRHWNGTGVAERKMSVGVTSRDVDRGLFASGWGRGTVGDVGHPTVAVRGDGSSRGRRVAALASVSRPVCVIVIFKGSRQC